MEIPAANETLPHDGAQISAGGRAPEQRWSSASWLSSGNTTETVLTSLPGPGGQCSISALLIIAAPAPPAPPSSLIHQWSRAGRAFQRSAVQQSHICRPAVLFILGQRQYCEARSHIWSARGLLAGLSPVSGQVWPAVFCLLLWRLSYRQLCSHFLLGLAAVQLRYRGQPNTTVQSAGILLTSPHLSQSQQWLQQKIISLLPTAPTG